MAILVLLEGVVGGGSVVSEGTDAINDKERRSYRAGVLSAFLLTCLPSCTHGRTHARTHARTYLLLSLVAARAHTRSIP